MLRLKFSILFILIKYLVIVRIYAAELSTFDVVNYCTKSIVILNIQGVPSYNFLYLHHPERLILDIPCVFPLFVEKFPIYFSHKNLIRSIYIDNLMSDDKVVRFIFDLNFVVSVDDVVLEKENGYYILLLVVTNHLFSIGESLRFYPKEEGVRYCLNSSVKSSVMQHNNSPYISYMGRDNYIREKFLKSNNVESSCLFNKMYTSPIVIAVDAGHGGYDPGAKGYSGLYEKDITIAIAKKFKKLLDDDPMFFPVMIRDGDYFLSVSKRSELARSKGAKVLLSIHADAISRDSKHSVRGASVWVLSGQRANIEMRRWLENTNRWSELSGGVSDILVSSVDSDPYFNRAILDLQFCYSQKVGYGIALKILNELKNVGVLHKYVPEYSNFGILRSLDIPSVLIEAGFITNKNEEKLLANDCYQEKIAHALYKGLRSYFFGYRIAFLDKRTNNQLYFDFKKDFKCSYQHCVH